MISIAPESIATASAPLERQVRASAAYIALINPLIMVLTLLHHAVPWSAKVRNITFILLGFLIYGYETSYAVRLLLSATDRSTLNALADLLIIISVFGVARAWELVGIRQFRVQDWLASLRASQKKADASHTHAANAKPDNNDET